MNLFVRSGAAALTAAALMLSIQPSQAHQQDPGFRTSAAGAGRRGPGAGSRRSGRPRRWSWESVRGALHRALRGLPRHRHGGRARAQSLRRPVGPRERRRGHRQGHRRRRAADRDDPVQGAADRPADLAARRLPEAAGRQHEAASDLRGRRGRTGDQEREADVQDRAGRAGHRDAVGARVPARRPPARDRARRQAAHHPEGQVGHRRDRDRHAQALGAPGRRLPRRRGAPAVREERLDLPGVFRAASRTTRRRLRRRRARRRRRPRDAAGEARRPPAFRR